MNKITYEDIIAINKKICDKYNKEFGILNENNLKGALSVFDSYYDTEEEVYSALFRSLIIAHGFLDANKRTALCTLLLLKFPTGCSVYDLESLSIEISHNSNIDISELAAKIYGNDRTHIIESILEFKTRVNTHQTHLEDLVLLGKDGIDELNDKIERFIARINGDTSSSNLSTKLDGAPAVIIFHRFEDYPDNSICLKSFLTSNKNCLSSYEDIENKYGDRPDMATKLRYCLELASCIPAGEAWQGDCLYSKGDLKEVEIGDTKYLTFQPNKIVYAFSEDNSTYETIKSSNFGICFHTIYTGNLEHKSQSFNVDASNLSNVPSNIYIMSPALDISNVKFNVSDIENKYNELKSKEQALLNDSAYEDLINNRVFMNYWNTFENANLSDKKATTLNVDTFIEDLKDYVKGKIEAKGYKRAETTEAKIQELYDIITNNESVLRKLVKCLNTASEIKMLLWNSLKQAKQNYSTFYKHREQGYIPASMEGAAFSDTDGNIVKIVDRSSFSNVNRDTNYLSGFEHESLDMKVVKEDTIKTSDGKWTNKGKEGTHEELDTEEVDAFKEEFE